MRKKLYKVLRDGKSPHVGFAYSLPTKDGPGDWHEITGDLTPHERAFHLTSDPNRRYARGSEVYRVETEGEVQHLGGDEYAARKVRLVARLMPSDLDKLGVGVDKTWRRSRFSRNDLIRKRAPEGASPALRLVALVYEHATAAAKKKGANHYDRMLGNAFTLTIEGGLEFAVGDFPEMARMIGNLSSEFTYAGCVQAGHVSAIKSWEAWTKRTPFLWEGERLYCGREITWAGRRVRVTAIDDEKGVVNLCAYKSEARDARGNTRTRATVDRRFKVDRAALAAGDKCRRLGEVFEKETETIQAAMKDCGVYVAKDLIAVWSEAERADALNWARLTEEDEHKTRVRPPARPRHTDAARDATSRHEILVKAAHKAWSEQNYKGRPKEILDTEVAAAHRAWLAWHEAGFVGRPADYLKPGRKVA